MDAANETTGPAGLAQNYANSGVLKVPAPGSIREYSLWSRLPLALLSCKGAGNKAYTCRRRMP